MSSLGLWEVMVAFSRANKKKHDEDLARESRDWSRRQAERRLQLEEQRIQASMQPRPETDATAELKRAQAEAQRQRAARLAEEGKWFGPKAEADIAAKGASTALSKARKSQIETMTPLQATKVGAETNRVNTQAADIEATLAPRIEKMDAATEASRAAAKRAAAAPTAGGPGGPKFDPTTSPDDRAYQLMMLEHRQKVADLSRALDLLKEMTVGQSRNSATGKERAAAAAAVEKAQAEVSKSFESIRTANEEYRRSVSAPSPAAAPSAPAVPFVTVEPPAPVATPPPAQVDATEAQWLKFKAAAAKVGARNVREFLMDRRAKETDPARQAEWDFWIRYAINGK